MIAPEQRVPPNGRLPCGDDLLEPHQIKGPCIPLGLAAVHVHDVKLEQHIQLPPVVYHGTGVLCGNKAGFPDTHTVPPVKARPSHFPQIVVQPGLERKILRGKHIAASLSVRQLRILCQKAYHIHPEPVYTAIQPAVHHPVNFLPKFGIFPVQIRLLLGEQMQIPLCCGLVIAPG